MNKNVSKQISYLLRHNPEDLIMDSNGYVLVEDLLKKIDINIKELENIVLTNDKQRFSFNSDKTKIKANQGHSSSLNVTIDYKKLNSSELPHTLYHGTTIDNLDAIKNSGGLLPMNRTHVHLSSSFETARDVGMRYAKKSEKLVMFKIDALLMHFEGNSIFLSENNVYLCNNVDLKYLKLIP